MFLPDSPSVASLSNNSPLALTGRRITPRFCLELLRSEDRAATTRALLSCVDRVKSEVGRQGREFKLQQNIGRVGRCIAVDVGLVDGQTGAVRKDQLRQRLVRNRNISERDRQFFLNELPTCDTFDTCFTKHCNL